MFARLFFLILFGLLPVAFAQGQNPEAISESEIWRLVEELLQNDAPLTYCETLERAGERAVPHLLRALKDPRFRQVHTTTAGMLPGGSREWSPLRHVLALLADHRPASAFQHLKPLLNHDHSIIRSMAAQAIGNTGTDPCVAPLQAILAGDDSNMGWAALRGIHHCLTDGAGSERFRAAMFTSVETLLRSEKKWSLFKIKKAPEILIRIDAKRAKRLLSSEAMLRHDFYGLYVVLQALNERNVSIPAERLLPLIEDLYDAGRKYPYKRPYGEALIALARTKHPKAKSLAREALSWNDEQISPRAATAICVLHGIDQPADFILDELEKVAFDDLTQPQRYYAAVRFLKWDVDNGGLVAYFLNSSGDHMHDALAGLKAMEAQSVADVLQSAMSMFGETGPAKEQRTRRAQVAKVLGDHSKRIETLNKEFFEASKLLEVKLLSFAADNADHFR